MPKHEYQITVTRTVQESGTVVIMAHSEEEAKAITDRMHDREFAWQMDFFNQDRKIVDVEKIDGRRRKRA